jgi:pimeloyl-ACP methyl ester carboxylesterase
VNFGNTRKHDEGFVTVEGRFRTCALEIEHLLPKESLEARALFVSPSKETHPNKPTVILLAGTGEHGYGRRLSSVAIPLAVQAGVSSVILESPFYGSRRPPNQIGSKLRKVSDLPVLGRVTIEESCSLVRFLTEQMDVKSVTLAGVSMGGLHSAMTASLCPQSVGVVSWLGPPSAAPVFTDGLLARFCEWKRLQTEVGSAAAAKDVMRSFLSLTDIGHFPKPVDATRSIFVIAQDDLYVPTNVSISLWDTVRREKWQGSRVVVVPGGHVSATVFGSSGMRKCIEYTLGVRTEETLFRENQLIF